MANSKPRILFYDCETTLLQCYVFSLGEQRLSHNQLIPGHSTTGIICITYCWNDGGPVKIIKWTPQRGMMGVIQDFDEIVKQADHTIGKNSDRFDTKVINALRMLNDLPGMPEWVRYTDDLEKQMRKYFKLPSQSLDYISDQLGLGGKIKMEFKDWVLINQWMEMLELNQSIKNKSTLETLSQHRYKKSLDTIINEGKKAFDKMCKYGMKDTRDTRTLWYKLSKHFEPKFNMATYLDKKIACKRCGSDNLVQNGTRVLGNTKWQRFVCNDCYYTGNRSPISQVKKLVGRVQ